MPSSRWGFTLIELSISLVVIALLIAAVVGGNTLLNQAKIRSYINEIMFYENAYNTFKASYNSPPGDFRKATSIWSSGCTQTASACNGNGNGNIVYNQTTSDETVKAWKHLSLAGLVPLTSTVIPDSLAGAYATGVDLGLIPTAKGDPGICYNFAGVVTTEWWDHIGDGIGYSFRDSGHNYLVMGGYYPAPSQTACIGVQNQGASSGFLAKNAFSIDSKIDDGKIYNGSALGANTGKFTVDARDAYFTPPAANGGWPCRTTTVDTYNMTTTVGGCVGLYKVD
jgi:prepilin-type N-terminal cleavage/methylation domain-containing protein